MLDHPTGVILNDDKIGRFRSGARHLYIVAGASRGGTSAVAYAMRRAGVNFGDVAELNHEPRSVMESPDEATIKRHIATLPGSLVGAKFPDFTWNLEWMDAAYPEAFFFFVMRNPLDIAKTIMNRDPNHSLSRVDFAAALDHGWYYYRQFAKVAMTMSRPVAVVSFERLQSNPAALIDLFEISGMHVGEDATTSLLNDLPLSGYRSLADEHRPG